MKTVFILESQVRDKIGRVKLKKHLGVFNTLDLLEKKKEEELKKDNNLTFEIYTYEHLLFE